MTAPSKMITVRLDPELFAAVRAKADEKNVNVSGLIRRALERWVAAE